MQTKANMVLADFKPDIAPCMLPASVRMRLVADILCMAD